MLRTLCLLLLVSLFVAVAPAQVPDPGRPPGQPVQLGTAYVFNNTPDDIVFVLSSAKGTIRATLRPGWAYQTFFEQDGRLRVLTTFVAANGDLISNRTIKTIDGNFYDAIAQSPPPVTYTKEVVVERGGKQFREKMQYTQSPAEEGTRRVVPMNRIQKAP